MGKEEPNHRLETLKGKFENVVNDYDHPGMKILALSQVLVFEMDRLKMTEEQRSGVSQILQSLYTK
ncbi:hypothetical protein I6N95_05195 [Vagococcus sp. BWB3-3]|uniref:Uncharacterized protein n=1 Tax=Vagococcus allomyrinae TaxID=2794353 RepID=A0A940SUU4_9ENTE|nr:hypothetical protein [Vagococcus allomyrinae]MBP1040406.1 hypothetical protein [Vagococcus allomyrinae]